MCVCMYIFYYYVYIWSCFSSFFCIPYFQTQFLLGHYTGRTGITERKNKLMNGPYYITSTHCIYGISAGWKQLTAML